MKHLVLLVGAVLIGTYSFASMQTTGNASYISAMTQAWNSNQVVNAAQLKDDVTMVYAGEDVSRNTSPTVLA